jgi:anti-sigma B factor antagonist
MEIKIEKFPSYQIVKVIGDMDLYSSFKLKEAVNSMMKEKVNNCIIDFQELKYIDSSGIGALLRINSLLDFPDKSFWIVNIQGQVKDIIKLARLYEYFPITTLEDAIQKIKSKGV